MAKRSVGPSSFPRQITLWIVDEFPKSKGVEAAGLEKMFRKSELQRWCSSGMGGYVFGRKNCFRFGR